MITFLVVGRNDNYGINLQKRTALSLNFFGSLCSDPNDEIIYVDCATPQNEVTLTEAIADTLTSVTRRRLRTIRVSAEQMQAEIGETPLSFSDELSRNVGIRRSNPANPWLLSTNCDVMVFPLKSGGFREVLRDLKPAFYACPRIGTPPEQWQQLSRGDVAGAYEFAESVIQRGMRLPPEAPQPWLRYRAVGDFQLAPRSHWFEIGGCEEGMKLWGHSDANNSLRLNLYNGGGTTPDLGSRLLVIHFDHAHHALTGAPRKPPRPENDWKRWIEDVGAPNSHNESDWGMEGIDLPEILLSVGPTSAREILASAPRPRRLWQTLRTRVLHFFWRKISGPFNHLEARISGR